MWLFHNLSFSDILIRDKNFKIQRNGSKGFIQLLSTLPTSYPGHSILTEDIGEIVDNHKCNCSFQGKRFLVHGRVKEAEIRVVAMHNLNNIKKISYLLGIRNL